MAIAIAITAVRSFYLLGDLVWCVCGLVGVDSFVDICLPPARPFNDDTVRRHTFTRCDTTRYIHVQPTHAHSFRQTFDLAQSNPPKRNSSPLTHLIQSNLISPTGGRPPTSRAQPTRTAIPSPQRLPPAHIARGIAEVCEFAVGL